MGIKQQNTVVLLCHSLTSSVDETELFASFFKRKGYATKQLLLAGHGGDATDLAGVGYKVWLSQLLDEYDKAFEEYQQVAVAGFSLGGLLSVAISSMRSPLFCVAVAPPLYTVSKVARLAGLFRFFRPLVKNRVLDQFSNWYLPQIPLSSIQQTLRLGRFVKKRVSEVRCPLLLLHSLSDRVIAPRSSCYLYHHCYTPEKELLLFSKGAHLLILPDLPTVQPALERIEEFLVRSNLLGGVSQQ